jgi:hypothetical protein
VEGGTAAVYMLLEVVAVVAVIRSRWCLDGGMRRRRGVADDRVVERRAGEDGVTRGGR